MLPRDTFTPVRLLRVLLRNSSSSSSSAAASSSQPEQKPTQDLVNGGRLRDQMSISSHPISRLRLIKLATRPGESEREGRLRERRMELQAWNHQYWLANNSEFNQVRDRVDDDEN